MYAFLSYVHDSLSFTFQTEVTTVICGSKELKKLMDIGQQLETVKRVICMDDEFPSDLNSNWMATSFADVQKLGRENPVDPNFPLSADVAVIMYTSGSTGLPKVRRFSKPVYVYICCLRIRILSMVVYGYQNCRISNLLLVLQNLLNLTFPLPKLCRVL